MSIKTDSAKDLVTKIEDNAAKTNVSKVRVNAAKTLVFEFAESRSGSASISQATIMQATGNGAVSRHGIGVITQASSVSASGTKNAAGSGAVAQASTVVASGTPIITKSGSASISHATGISASGSKTSDPLTTTYVGTDSSSFKISGSNYTAAQKTQRQKLMYYGRSSVRYEGALCLFNYSSIQSMLATRPVVSSIKVRITYQHSYSSGGENIQVGWHGESALGSEPNTGWVAPSATQEKTVAVGKSTPGVRVELEWTGSGAQTVADNLADGTWKGIGIHIRSGAAANDWGWCAGADERSTGESTGTPTGYAAVDSSNRIEIIIEADYT